MKKQNTFELTKLMKVISPAIPVMMGYIPIGFAYGVLSVNAGISTVNTVLMSLIVFAGSAQLMATSFFAQGLNPYSIIFTTLIVNLRHMLMSASLSPHMEKWKKTEVAGFCYELTDETFAVHSMRFNNGEKDAYSAIAINLICQGSWIAGTILGVLLGNLITDVKPFALDYALPAMFIALLILQIKSNRHIWVALCGGMASIFLWKFGITQWNVIIATVLAATLGALFETVSLKKKNEGILKNE